jgi:hypothetical protein
MFLAVGFGWVFFRATSFGMAVAICRKLLVPTDGLVVSDIQLPMVLGTMLLAAWWSMRGPNAFEMEHVITPRRRLTLSLAFGAGLALIVTARPSPFLYFQF